MILTAVWVLAIDERRASERLARLEGKRVAFASERTAARLSRACYISCSRAPDGN